MFNFLFVFIYFISFLLFPTTVDLQLCSAQTVAHGKHFVLSHVIFQRHSRRLKSYHWSTGAACQTFDHYRTWSI